MQPVGLLELFVRIIAKFESERNAENIARLTAPRAELERKHWRMNVDKNIFSFSRSQPFLSFIVTRRTPSTQART